MSEGGGRSYVTNLLAELRRDARGFDWSMLAQPGQLDGIDTAGVEIRLVRIPQRPARVVWRVAYEELVMPFASRSFDLLFCLADLCPRFSLAPAVVLLRNLNIYDRRWYDDARTRTLERLVRFGLPNARRILFPSQAAADLISGFIPVPRDRVRVVHYGVSPEAFGQAPSEGSGTRFLFLPAAVEKHKNVGVLIECLQHVRDPELQVWIAGRSLLDPEHQQDLERRAAELGVAERVRFLGAVPYAEVLRYHARAAALVFPSFIETFGHPLLEAMLAGTPVIAADIPTFREIAGGAALYFPPSDAVALARAVDRLLDEPQATAERIAIGRELAETFSWRRSVDGLCDVFREVLGEGAPREGIRTGSR